MLDANKQAAELVVKTQKVLEDYLTGPLTISKQDVIDSLLGLYDGAEYRATVNVLMKRSPQPEGYAAAMVG